MLSRREFLKLSLAAGAGVVLPWQLTMPNALASVQTPQVPLPGGAIAKWVNPMPHFAGQRVNGSSITVAMSEFQQKVLPAAFYTPLDTPYNAGTYVWGYTVGSKPPMYPGFTVEATKGIPTTMTYVNNLPVSASNVQKYIMFDQSLHWANPDGVPMMVPFNPPPPHMVGNPQIYNGSPPAVVHLHGAEVLSDYDGGPEQWYTSDARKGPAYRSAPGAPGNGAVYVYPNGQDAATLWFHDHTLGVTRLNVYAGLAAFYLLRDPATMDTGVPAPGGLPAEDYEIEIVIQDRMFDTNGQWFFPDAPPLNPEHPYWIPEFLGDATVVNGKTWPFLEVEPRRYRFRFLNGSNARFYNMWLEDMVASRPGPPFWQIGTDGGLLDLPVKLDPADKRIPLFLLMAPGERADVIIDFSNFAGKTLTLRNNARAPFPKGTTVDPGTVGQIMQFRVVKPLVGTDNSYNPDPATGGGGALRTGTYTIKRLPGTPAGPVINPPGGPVNVDKFRQLTLNEVMGMPTTLTGSITPGVTTAYIGGPIEVLVNNTKWTGKRWELVGGIPQLVPIPGFANDGQGNYFSENPQVGKTEVWEIINLTADAHPIHLHLVQFQLVNRQKFNVNKYTAAYNGAFPGGGYDHMTEQAYPAGVYIPAFGPPSNYNIPNADGALGGNPAIGPYLQGLRGPAPNELGWKDTVIMYPGEVTRIVVRWKKQDGNPYAFDATSGPGYVWQCHIIDQEDNEMMRPYCVIP